MKGGSSTKFNWNSKAGSLKKLMKLIFGGPH